MTNLRVRVPAGALPACTLAACALAAAKPSPQTVTSKENA